MNKSFNALSHSSFVLFEETFGIQVLLFPSLCLGVSFLSDFKAGSDVVVSSLFSSQWLSLLSINCIMFIVFNEILISYIIAKS